jgi:hypothetical protein
MSDGDFYEDDEATEAVLAAYEEGAKGVTGRPAPRVEWSDRALGDVQDVRTRQVSPDPQKWGGR